MSHAPNSALRAVVPHEPVPLIDLTAQYQTIKGEVLPAVEELFESQRFVLGDAVSDFEAEIAAYCDSRYAIGCASGSDALYLTFMAMGLGPGDEVITTPFSFFATASAIDRTGAKIVFADIDPVSFNIDPAAVEAAITPRTKAILPVHLFGQCADMEPLLRIASKYGLAVIEDAAQAIGASYQGRKAGVLGTAACFSFFPTKNLGGAGDGGMITTDDKNLATKLKRLRVHGDAGRYEHLEVGINSRLDALQAVVLSVKLRHLDDWANARSHNAKRYTELLRNQNVHDVVQLPKCGPEQNHVYNQFCLRIKDGYRDAVMTDLREQQVGCAVYYPISLHEQKCFEHLGYKQGDFPHSEQACEEVLALPIFAELTDEQLVTVADAIGNSVAGLRRNHVHQFPQEERRAA